MDIQEFASSVGIVTRLQAGWFKNWDFLQGKEIVLFFTSKLTLGPTKPPVQ
jgi:hypothetical protein